MASSATKNELSVKHQIGYACGDLGGCMTVALMGAMVTRYYTNVLKVDYTVLAVLLLIWNIWDAVNDPLMGILMDKIYAKHHNKNGKFRPWLLRIAPLLCVAAIAFWTVPTFFQGTTLLVVLFFCKILYEGCYTMFNIPMGSLLGAMANNDAERSALSSARGFGSLIGNVLPLMILPQLLAKYGDTSFAFGVGSAICAVIGLCNGLVVSFLRVQPFIATLGMQQVVYGICLVYTGGTPIGSLNSGFTSIAIDNFLGVPILIWIAVIVAVFFWFLYNKTRHGKYMYAIGGNESAAEVAGVNVAATKIRIYVLASCMFGLAGCLLAAKSGGASVNTAQSYELDAIAAATIGGVSTTGGVGTVPGILVGVLVFELMKVALQFMNVNSSYTYIVQGLVIILAVAIDIRKYLAKK